MVRFLEVSSKVPFAVLIIGGKSTRFYPMGSKLFDTLGIEGATLPILGENSLFQERLLCLHQTVEHIVVVGGKEFRTKAESQSARIGVPIHFVVELSPRGTAPAYLLGLSYIAARWSNANSDLVLLSPSDHIHCDTGRFNQSIVAAAQLVKERGKIATFVVEPRFPSDGFSYLLPISSLNPEVRCFVQKPTQQEAFALIEQGASWGLGVHLGALEVLRGAILQHEAILDEAEVSDWWHLLKEQINLEGGIFCRITSQLIIVDVTDSGWSDIGTVEELLRLLPVDEAENVLVGSRLSVRESSRCRIINASTISLVVEGLSDVVVALSRDRQLLVAPIGESESIRHYLSCEQRVVTDPGHQVSDELEKLQRVLVFGMLTPIIVSVGTEVKVSPMPESSF